MPCVLNIDSKHAMSIFSCWPYPEQILHTVLKPNEKKDGGGGGGGVGRGMGIGGRGGGE